MNYISADFHLHYISSYTLYIQSDVIHDQVVVVDADNQVLAFISYDNLAPTAEAVRLLSMPFQKVYINLMHQNLIWVPSDVFEESEKDLYVDYFADIHVNDLRSKEVREIEAFGLYHHDLLAQKKWQSLFPEATIVPSFELFLRQGLAVQDNDSELMGIQFYDNQADIFLFINGEMRLYNTFEIATTDDLSYFVLSIMKNFSISGKVQKIVLSGAKVDSEWGARLRNYTQQLTEMSSSFSWKCDDSLVQEKINTLNTLSDITVCV